MSAVSLLLLRTPSSVLSDVLSGVLLAGWFRHVGVTDFALQHAERVQRYIPWARENEFSFTLSWIITGIPRNKKGGKLPATVNHGHLSPKRAT